MTLAITGGTGTNVILGDSGRILSASSDTNRFGDLPMTIGLVVGVPAGIVAVYRRYRGAI